MSITGDADEGWRSADEGRGGHQRRRHRAVCHDRDPRRVAAPRHGQGQRVDVSLLGSTLAILVNQAQNAFVAGRRRSGGATPIRTSSPTRLRHGRRRAGGGGRVGAPVAAVLRGDRAAVARRGLAIRHQRRPRGTPCRASSDHRRAARQQGHARVGRGPRRRGDPQRSDRRCGRGVRLARGGGPRDVGDRRAPRARGPAPGGDPDPLRIRRRARSGPVRPRSANTPTRSSRRSVTTPRRSRTCGRAASSKGSSSVHSGSVTFVPLNAPSDDVRSRQLTHPRPGVLSHPQDPAGQTGDPHHDRQVHSHRQPREAPVQARRPAERRPAHPWPHAAADRSTGLGLRSRR